MGLAPCFSRFLINSADIMLKAVSTCVASLAEVSMKGMPSSSAFFCASSVETCLPGLANSPFPTMEAHCEVTASYTRYTPGPKSRLSAVMSHLFPSKILEVLSFTYLLTSFSQSST